MEKKKLMIMFAAALSLCACSSGDGTGQQEEPETPGAHNIPIKISTSIDDVSDTQCCPKEYFNN